MSKRAPDTTDEEWDRQLADRKKLAEERMKQHDEDYTNA